jgi:hypothetical protein
MLANFQLGRGSSTDLLTFRDSVSDAARRARRRRGGVGSPSMRMQCQLVRHASYSSASVHSGAEGNGSQPPPRMLPPKRTVSYPFHLGDQSLSDQGAPMANPFASPPPPTLRARSLVSNHHSLAEHPPAAAAL